MQIKFTQMAVCAALLAGSLAAVAADYPTIKYGNAIVGEYVNKEDKIDEGITLSLLKTMEVVIQDYSYENTTWTDFVVSGEGGLYDCTSGSPVLIKSCPLKINKRGTNGLYLFPVVTIEVNEPLLKDHTYKVMLPENIVKPGSKTQPCAFAADVPSELYSFTFTGGAATTVKMEWFSHADTKVIYYLDRFRWYLSGEYEIANPEGVKARYIVSPNAIIGDGPLLANAKGNLSTSYYNGRTYLRADYFLDEKTGEPRKIWYTTDVTITIAEGTLVNKHNPEIKNAEMTFVVAGEKYEDPEPEYIYVQPEYVDVNTTLNGLHSVKSRTAKGEDFALSIVPDSNWELTSLKVNGQDKSESVDASGTLTLPAVNDNLDINAEVTYAGQLVVADTSGVAILPESDVTIASSGDEIVISGLKGWEHISVYSVSGLLVTQHTAAEDTVRIRIDSGQYIVRVNDKAAKLNH